MLSLDLSFYNWELFTNYILKGLLFSVQLTVFATVGGILFGTFLALMRLSGRSVLVYPATFYVNTMRSIPLVMVILWFFLLIPMLIGTRVQIGLLILITSILFISFFQGIKVLSLFLFSAVTVSLVFMAFLNNFGWLRDSLYDQFVYGSTYLKAGSVDGYSSKPIFTTSCICVLSIIKLSIRIIFSS